MINDFDDKSSNEIINEVAFKETVVQGLIFETS